jgi:hypothetical protein
VERSTGWALKLREHFGLAGELFRVEDPTFIVPDLERAVRRVF